MEEMGFHLLVLCHGEERRRLLFEPIPGEAQADSLELAWQIEESSPQQQSMEEYLTFAEEKLLSSGYRLVRA